MALEWERGVGAHGLSPKLLRFTKMGGMEKESLKRQAADEKLDDGKGCAGKRAKGT